MLKKTTLLLPLALIFCTFNIKAAETKQRVPNYFQHLQKVEPADANAKQWMEYLKSLQQIDPTHNDIETSVRFKRVHTAVVGGSILRIKYLKNGNFNVVEEFNMLSEILLDKVPLQKALKQHPDLHQQLLVTLKDSN